jgi:hypothetical protein
MVGRPPIYGRPMSAAERKQRHRAKLEALRQPERIRSEIVSLLDHLNRMPPNIADAVLRTLGTEIAKRRRRRVQ